MHVVVACIFVALISLDVESIALHGCCLEDPNLGSKSVLYEEEMLYHTSYIP